MIAASAAARMGSSPEACCERPVSGAFCDPRGEAAALQRAIVAEARRWLGTPYHHQASLKGVGCDCLGLLRGVWRGVVGREPELPPAYSWDWAEASRAESLRDAARRHLIEIAPGEFAAGDVLLFRMSRAAPAKHCAIATSLTHMIHAWTGHAVAEAPIDRFWRRRLAYAFRFPAQR
jgi:NlpC/P60 family putative phage cell wall peptidase